MSDTFTIETVRPLTRAEDAYAHLAAFPLGAKVILAGEDAYAPPGETISMPGVIAVPQRVGDVSLDPIEGAYVIVDPDPEVFGWGRQFELRRLVRVSDLLSGRYTLTSPGGSVRFFDEAGYATQNQAG